MYSTVNALSDVADPFQKAGRVLRLHEPRAVTLDTSAVAFNGSISIYSAFTLIGILSLEPLSPLVQVTILQY